MIFEETNFKGVYVIKLEKRTDERGFFARTFCAEEFKKRGLHTHFVQANMSLSIHQHTLRGMHYQLGGAEEAKLVRCTKGALLDVIIDVRKHSDTYLKHFKIELTEHNHIQLYVPEGFAHGFITLLPSTEVAYMVSHYYTPGKEHGIRWNDPLFAIQWPVSNPVLSEKDATHPNFVP